MTRMCRVRQHHVPIPTLQPIPVGVPPLVVACELVQDLEQATAEEHQAQEWLRVEMVVLEEPQRVVEVDGDAWGRAVAQTLEADAHHQER